MARRKNVHTRGHAAKLLISCLVEALYAEKPIRLPCASPEEARRFRSYLSTTRARLRFSEDDPDYALGDKIKNIVIGIKGSDIVLRRVDYPDPESRLQKQLDGFLKIARAHTEAELAARESSSSGKPGMQK